MDLITSQILISAVSYVFGLISGLFLHNIFKNKRVESNDIVLISVTLIWVLSRLFAMINLQYVSSPLIDTLMGMVVGFFTKIKLPFKLGGDKYEK